MQGADLSPDLEFGPGYGMGDAYGAWGMGSGYNAYDSYNSGLDAVEMLQACFKAGTPHLLVRQVWTKRSQLDFVIRYVVENGTPKVQVMSDYGYDLGKRLIRLETFNFPSGTFTLPIGFHDDFEINASDLRFSSKIAYTYDKGGRILVEQNTGTFPYRRPKDDPTFSYDEASQLKKADLSRRTDKNGNIIIEKEGSFGTAIGTTVVSKIGPGNRLLADSTWQYTYDGEGNLVKKTKGGGDTWLYGYDNANHLVWARNLRKDPAASPGKVDRFFQAISPAYMIAANINYVKYRADYKYDALGNRLEIVSATSNADETTQRFAYIGQDVWADLNDDNTLKTRYLNGDGQVARLELLDRLRSVRRQQRSAGLEAGLQHLDGVEAAVVGIVGVVAGAHAPGAVGVAHAVALGEFGRHAANSKGSVRLSS